MPMLSSLLHYRVVDAMGRTARLRDLAIDLKNQGYPLVSYLIIRDPQASLPSSTEDRSLAWEHVRSIDHRAQTIRVESLDQGTAPDRDWWEKAVLLDRDILDALLLDLHLRTPIIANDLWLEERDNALSLKGVDISFHAVLRRLTRGILFSHHQPHQGQPVDHTEHDWKYIEFLRGNPQAVQAGLTYHGLISHLPHGEIAYLADLLPYHYTAELLSMLPDTTAADTMEIMTPTRQLQAFVELDHAKAIRLLTLMRPDVVSDLLARMDLDDARQWLNQMPHKQAERVIDLLHYQSDTAGGIMTNDFVSLPASSPVREALPHLVEQLKLTDFINFIQFVYVVDDETRQRLRGFLSLRDLLVADPSKTLGEVMDPYLITMNPMEKSDPAARRVIESGMSALPVVDAEDRLLGIITIDTALGLVVQTSDTRENFRIFS